MFITRISYTLFDGAFVYKLASAAATTAAAAG